MENNYAIEMLHITKEFPGIKANDDVTIQLKKGEIHALLGENGAGKSTLMSILFGLYQPDSGIIKKDGKEVKITDPNVATSLHIGMVHQHFKLVEVYSVLDNIILGDEPIKEYNFSAKNKVLNGFLKGFSKTMTFLNKHIFKVIDRKKAYDQVVKLSNQYGLFIEPNAKVQDITVGMQQRVEILKMLYRENDVLIFDEPTAVLTPQEISELMEIMKKLASEGKSILFITHKLNEIKKVADRCTVLRKGRCIGTVDVANVTKEELSEMMVGRKVQLIVDKTEAKPKDVVLKVENLVIIDKLHKTNAVNNVSFDVRKGEIVCIAGIDGNGQTDLVYGITGLEPIKSGKVYLNNVDITNLSIRKRLKRTIGQNFKTGRNEMLQRYMDKEINIGFIGYSDTKFDKKIAKQIIYDIFQIIERKYCTDDNLNTKINIITGATNLGIPAIVYEIANNENIKYGKWFTLVGVMAKEGYQYELYPCDEIYSYGENFGDESEEFINRLDILYKIGGGKQSIKEFQMANDKGIEVYEYSL